MKKLALLLVALLLASVLLTACESESQDAAKDYIDALLNGEIENAEGFTCDDFEVQIVSLEDSTDLYANLPGLGDSHEIRNIDLKYDLGKGNNPRELIITGSYDIVEIDEQGRLIPDSETQYVLASAVRDRRDIDRDGDVTERIDTRILLEMREDGDDWCVRMLDGGYWAPALAAEVEGSAEAEDSAAVEDAAETDEE